MRALIEVRSFGDFPVTFPTNPTSDKRRQATKACLLPFLQQRVLAKSH